MNNHEVIEQTLHNYELANEALLDIWEHLDAELIDDILEKQQHRLEQISERLYHEEKHDEFYDSSDHNTEIIENTMTRFDWANQYLYEHWDTLPKEERLSIMQKQWNRIEDMRNRNQYNQ